jgi:hypothetical protein
VACPFVSSSTRKSCSTEVEGPHFASGSSSFTFTTRTTGTAGFGGTRRPFFLAPRVARAGDFAARSLGAARLGMAAFGGVFGGDFAAGLAGTETGAALAPAFFVTFDATFAAGLPCRFSAAGGFAAGLSAAGRFAAACFAAAFLGGGDDAADVATVLPAPFTGAETERFAAVEAVEAGGAAWRFAAVLVPATRRPLAC